MTTKYKSSDGVLKTWTSRKGIHKHNKEIEEQQSIKYNIPAQSKMIKPDKIDQAIEQLSKDYSSIQLNQSMISQHLDVYKTYPSELGKTESELEDIAIQVNSSVAKYQQTLGSKMVLMEEYIEMISSSNKYQKIEINVKNGSFAPSSTCRR